MDAVRGREPQGCGVAPGPKPDAVSRGYREAARVAGGAGGVGGAAASAPNPVAFAGDY